MGNSDNQLAKAGAVDAEIVEEGSFQPGAALAAVASVEGTLQHLRTLQSFVREVMAQGLDYGVIPGTQGMTLLKPGADKLCAIYGLSVHVVESKRELDWAANFLSFTVTVQLRSKRTGQPVAEGIGNCNSYERRYANQLNKQNNPATLGDLFNTILKMSKKRALVDATLSACGASGIFVAPDYDEEAVEARQEARQEAKQTSNGKRSAPARGSGNNGPAPQPQAAPAASGAMTREQRKEIEQKARAAYGDEWQRIVEQWQEMPFDDWGAQRAGDVLANLNTLLARQQSARQAAPQAPPRTDAQAPPTGSVAPRHPGDDDDSNPFADE